MVLDFPVAFHSTREHYYGMDRGFLVGYVSCAKISSIMLVFGLLFILVYFH